MIRDSLEMKQEKSTKIATNVFFLIRTPINPAIWRAQNDNGTNFDVCLFCFMIEAREISQPQYLENPPPKKKKNIASRGSPHLPQKRKVHVSYIHGCIQGCLCSVPPFLGLITIVFPLLPRHAVSLVLSTIATRVTASSIKRYSQKSLNKCWYVYEHPGWQTSR